MWLYYQPAQYKEGEVDIHAWIDTFAKKIPDEPEP